METTYDDLDEFQKEVVDGALDKLENYEQMDLEELDAEEVLEYDDLSDRLEGVEVGRGEMSEEDLKGYLQAGILTRNGEDNLEINSVRYPGHIEKLKDNSMIDFYAAEDEETGMEKLVYGNEDSYHSVARHGGKLAFGFEEDIDSELNGEPYSDRKIEEMVAEFVAESQSLENKEEYIENFDIEEFKENSSVTLSFIGEESEAEKNDIPLPAPVNDTIVPKTTNNQQKQGGETMSQSDNLPATTGGPSDSFQEHLDNVNELTGDIMELYDSAENGLEDGREVLEDLEREVQATLTEYNSMSNQIKGAKNEMENLYETLDRFGSLYTSDLEGIRSRTQELQNNVEEIQDYSSSILNTLEDREYPDEEMTYLNDKLGEADEMLDALDEAEESRDW